VQRRRLVLVLLFITAVPGGVCVLRLRLITAVPITMLFAKGGSGGHVQSCLRNPQNPCVCWLFIAFIF
jgi:hypothetical protein